jgi:hypothetical protein
MYDAFAATFTMERLAAFFSYVWPSVAVNQPRMVEFTAYAPLANRTQARYRAPVFMVAHEMMYPTKAAPMLRAMCHIRSL